MYFVGGLGFSRRRVWWQYEVRISVMNRKGRTRKTKPRGGNLLIAIAVALFVVLLLLRMIVFVAGHGHHRL
jgi:hypothetical protein